MTASQNFSFEYKVGPRGAATHIHAAACNPHHRVTSRAYCFSWGHALFQAGAAPQRKLKKFPVRQRRGRREWDAASQSGRQTTHLSLVTSICSAPLQIERHPLRKFTHTHTSRQRADARKHNKIDTFFSSRASTQHYVHQVCRMIRY